jgi:two-component system sensor histidine kinase AlgZ
VASINQKSYPDSLPNFRNLGVILRILIIVNVIGFMAALLRAPTWLEVIQEFAEIAVVIQPILLMNLLLLYGLYKPLSRLSYTVGVCMVLVLQLILATAMYWFGGMMSGSPEAGEIFRYWVFCLTVTGVLLAYFNLRSRALSPAFTEARLQALQARIRPHFLFNCINAVLSLIRADPKRAEHALEDMADLFRVLMADNRQLSPLQREIELCQQYLQLEQLRLGERLKVEWHIDNLPSDALIPPLVLQPLLENAVYHGIEPIADTGIININIYKSRNEVHIVLRNPYQTEGKHHSGNKMALNNIRERLALHFDAESRLENKVSDNIYQVHIIIPFVTTV